MHVRHGYKLLVVKNVAAKNKRFNQLPSNQHPFKEKLFKKQPCQKLESLTINPIQDGGGSQKASTLLPTSFSLVTSTKVGISPNNFLTFSFKIFFCSGVTCQVCIQCQYHIIELDTKKSDFPGQILTSLKEMLELPKFGHKTTSTV